MFAQSGLCRGDGEKPQHTDICVIWTLHIFQGGTIWVRQGHRMWSTLAPGSKGFPIEITIPGFRPPGRLACLAQTSATVSACRSSSMVEIKKNSKLSVPGGVSSQEPSGKIHPGVDRVFFGWVDTTDPKSFILSLNFPLSSFEQFLFMTAPNSVDMGDECSTDFSGIDHDFTLPMPTWRRGIRESGFPQSHRWVEFLEPPRHPDRQTRCLSIVWLHHPFRDWGPCQQ